MEHIHNWYVSYFLQGLGQMRKKYRWVSLAYWWLFTTNLHTISLRSVIYMLNRRGNKKDPWRTPVERSQDHKHSPITILWVFSTKKEWNQFRLVLQTPTRLCTCFISTPVSCIKGWWSIKTDINAQVMWRSWKTTPCMDNGISQEILCENHMWRNVKMLHDLIVTNPYGTTRKV